MGYFVRRSENDCFTQRINEATDTDLKAIEGITAEVWEERK